MKFEYIEPFVNSTVRVIDAVIKADVRKGDLALIRTCDIYGDMSIVIRVEGDSEGDVILNMGKDTAVGLSRRMTGEDDSVLTPMVIDSISELANMITGNATSTLNDMGYDFRVGAPSVVTRDEMVGGDPEREVFRIPLDTDFGQITINIMLRTN